MGGAKCSKNTVCSDVICILVLRVEAPAYTIKQKDLSSAPPEKHKKKTPGAAAFFVNAQERRLTPLSTIRIHRASLNLHVRHNYVADDQSVPLQKVSANRMQLQ